MNKKQIVEKLVKIANDLDVLDLSIESDQLTKVAEKVLLAEIEYSPDFNPDFEADDAEAKTISSPVYDAALALVKAHKAGKMTDEEFASAVAAMADDSTDTSDNVKELTFENKMPDMDDMDGMNDMDDMPEMGEMNQEGYTEEEEEFFVDGKMPEDIEGQPSFKDLMAEYRAKYGKE
jgi:hypothetical protein